MRISDWSSDVCSSDLYAARLTAYMRFHDVDAHIAVLSCDEKGKTIAAVQDIVRRTQEAGLRRADLLVSMGGGVCRSEERRVGNGCVSTRRACGAPHS